MNNKISFLSLVTLILLSCISCNVFDDQSSFSCNDLVVTGEDSPEAIDYIGEPSNQWSVTGLNENVTDTTNSGIIYSYGVHPAYPNPTYSLSNLSISIPEETRVKIEITGNNSNSKKIIVDEVLDAGQYTTFQVDLNRDNNCYEVKYFFGKSSEENAFGIISIKS